MELTEVHDSEITEVLELQYLCYRSEAELYNDFNIPPLLQSLDELRDEVKNGLCLVAKTASRVTGSVRAYVEGDICKIGKLIVHPDHQRQGIGTQLLLEIEQRFPAAVAYEVFTGHKSINNINLYSKLGYTFSSEKKLNEKVTLTYLTKVRAA